MLLKVQIVLNMQLDSISKVKIYYENVIPAVKATSRKINKNGNSLMKPSNCIQHGHQGCNANGAVFKIGEVIEVNCIFERKCAGPNSITIIPFLYTYKSVKFYPPACNYSS